MPPIRPELSPIHLYVNELEEKLAEARRFGPCNAENIHTLVLERNEARRLLAEQS